MIKFLKSIKMLMEPSSYVILTIAVCNIISMIINTNENSVINTITTALVFTLHMSNRYLTNKGKSDSVANELIFVALVLLMLAYIIYVFIII